MIEEDDVGGDGGGCAGDFFELAFADERGGIGTVAMLHELAGNLGSGAGGERAQFVKRFFGAEVGRIDAARGGDAGGVIAGGLSSSSERGVARSGAAARAEFYPDKERAFAALRGIEDGLELTARASPFA